MFFQNIIEKKYYLKVLLPNITSNSLSKIYLTNKKRYTIQDKKWSKFVLKSTGKSMERNVQNPGKCISILLQGPLVLCTRCIVVINHLWQLLLCNSLILGDISNLHLFNRLLKTVIKKSRIN